MEKFKDIPQILWPNEKTHMNYIHIYRATRHIDHLNYEDFLPRHIEYINQKKTFDKLFDSNYSVSLCKDLEQLKKLTNPIPLIKSYSIGFTNIKRGVSPVSNSQHIDYYLYDYINNSPCSDFEIIEVKK